MLPNLAVDVVVVTMEAVLIEGLEPRQNRKRGDDFKAVEYLQVEDPSIEVARMKAMMRRIEDSFSFKSRSFPKYVDGSIGLARDCEKRI